MRVMGLDIGDKRIGVALGNKIIGIATSYKVIERKNELEDIKIINDIVKNEEVEEIIYGLPKNMDGTESHQAGKISEFVEKFKSQITVPLISWDERLSTCEAEKFLIDTVDLSRGKRKKVIDKLSAQIILQNYLDYEVKRG